MSVECSRGDEGPEGPWKGGRGRWPGDAQPHGTGVHLVRHVVTPCSFISLCSLYGDQGQSWNPAVECACTLPLLHVRLSRYRRHSVVAGATKGSRGPMARRRTPGHKGKPCFSRIHVLTRASRSMEGHSRPRARRCTTTWHKGTPCWPCRHTVRIYQSVHLYGDQGQSWKPAVELTCTLPLIAHQTVSLPPSFRRGRSDHQGCRPS